MTTESNFILTRGQGAVDNIWDDSLNRAIGGMVFTEEFEKARAIADAGQGTRYVVVRETRYAHREKDAREGKLFEWSPGWQGTHDAGKQAEIWVKRYLTEHNAERYDWLAEHLAANGNELYVIANNERPVATAGEAREFAAFEAAVYRHLLAFCGPNVRLIGGNFAVGTATEEIINAYLGEWYSHFDHCDFGLHHYGAIWPWGLMDDNQVSAGAQSQNHADNAAKAALLNARPFPPFRAEQQRWLVGREFAWLKGRPNLTVHITEWGPSDKHAAGWNLWKSDNETPVGGVWDSLKFWRPLVDTNLPAMNYWHKMLDWQMNYYLDAATVYDFELGVVALFLLGDNYNAFVDHDYTRDDGKLYWQGIAPHLGEYAYASTMEVAQPPAPPPAPAFAPSRLPRFTKEREGGGADGLVCMYESDARKVLAALQEAARRHEDEYERLADAAEILEAILDE